MNKKQANHTKPLFTVIVPCYNEIESLPNAVADLIVEIDTTDNWELFFIDDGSTDGTSEKLLELKSVYSNLNIINHSKNKGYGAAIKTGIKASNSQNIVITDADGTYPNNRIPELVSMLENYDMVVGSRTSSNVTYSKLRAFPKIFLTAYASWIAGEKIPDINSGLRAFKKDCIKRYIRLLSDKFSFTTTSTLALLTNAHSVKYEPIDYYQRTGKSKIRPIRDTLRFVALIMRMGMYFAPLRVLLPFIAVLGTGFLVSLSFDIFIIKNITDKTILLLLFSMNTGFFALLADMIEKRNKF